MHSYTCKSLLSTVGRAVEQLAGYLAKQAKSAVEVSTKICNTRAQGRGGWTHTLTDLHETPCHVWLVNIAKSMWRWLLKCIFVPIMSHELEPVGAPYSVCG